MGPEVHLLKQFLRWFTLHHHSDVTQAPTKAPGQFVQGLSNQSFKMPASHHPPHSSWLVNIPAIRQVAQLRSDVGKATQILGDPLQVVVGSEYLVALDKAFKKLGIAAHTREFP